jgi:hypothetical protein
MADLAEPNPQKSAVVVHDRLRLAGVIDQNIRDLANDCALIVLHVVTEQGNDCRSCKFRTPGRWKTRAP